MSYLAPFTDPAAARSSSSGGKGTNLAILTQRGFPVPPGFIVVAQAYVDFVRAGLHLLERVPAFHAEEPSVLRQESEDLCQDLRTLPLPPGLSEELHLRLSEYGSEQAFSVRSSSTMEDLATAAFAGQHETYLNVRGADQILARTKDCYLSMWADRAIAYRHQQQFDHSLATMAVVVQVMIPCEVAGVGFSINPVTGNLGEMVIDANFGLGESVVSGEAEVDHFELSREDGTVTNAVIAAKSRRVVCDAEGTREEEVPEADSRRPCLGASELEALADLLLRVERSYQFPQDIEWGFHDGKLHLLQSRPVTTIPPRWTRDESAERFPNVITPLTWDLVESGFHRSLTYSFRLMQFPPFNGKWFSSHGHYIYGNQNAVVLYGQRTPFAVSSMEELRRSVPQLRERFRWVLELPAVWHRDLDYYLIRIGELMLEPLEQSDPQGVWEFVKRVNEVGAEYFQPNIAVSITQSTLCRVLLGLLRLAVGPERATGLYDRLMAYCDTKTGAINKELFGLACLVRDTPGLEGAFDQHSSREIIGQRTLTSFPNFEESFRQFLRNHGHREVDFDAYHPTWLEAPWAVLDSLRLILQAPKEATPAEKERSLKITMHQAEMELFAALPQDLQFFYHEILRLARLYTSLDDFEHYQTTRLTLPLRRGLRELGERLQSRGVLDEPMDIFFAHAEDLDRVLAVDTDQEWQALAQRVRDEKADYLSDRQRTPDWVLGEAREERPHGDHWEGIPGSPGQAEGEVFQVLSPDDFAKCPKGCVLVARTTSPTWTPLFYNAVAVVTESGGPLSHGAVTAREMCIPAVMSVAGCLETLPDGSRVRVDGSGGKVYLCD